MTARKLERHETSNNDVARHTWLLELKSLTLAGLRPAAVVELSTLGAAERPSRIGSILATYNNFTIQQPERLLSLLLILFHWKL